MTNIKLLASLNVAHSEAELRDTIDSLADYLANGTICAVNDGDSIESFRLTEHGKALWRHQNLHH
jgi:hypothetical protein